ncbi:MAG TPA: NPCBM/NEW2 domain-containing protein, partial [Solirubrobacteraceae bacterium]|nr:NPCBM/NEW2 domain-containing protein [Solirubrobacteraceae bacterium]
VSVAGASGLRLVVTNGGDNTDYDHADWANARIECSSTPAQPPANTSAPTTSGPARQGQTQTTTNGTWSGATPMTFKYQWRRCNSAGAGCVNIAGTAATVSTYAPVPADVGSRLVSQVTATNSVGSAQANSAPTAVVTP